MKRYISRIAFLTTPYLVTMAMSYMVGAMCAASWDLVEWTRDLRVFTAISGVCWGIALMIRLEFDLNRKNHE